ncbi:MAG: hypothetical protein AB1689_19130, partial [Thermodesulfobacteriota bacterium]
RHDQALARARRIGSAFDVALALTNAVELLYALDDAPGTLRLADEGIALAKEHSFPLWLAILGAARGWAAAATGEAEDGLAQLERSLREFEALGGRSVRALVLAMLGLARVRAGRPDGAAELFALALELVEQTGDRRHLAEIHRLAGTCHAGASTGRAEACYRRAIDVARAQGARWWELRATTSLASVLARRRAREALELLEPLCASFDEGADTADVRRARALVEELRRARS